MSYFRMEYYRLEEENKRLKNRIAELERQLESVKPQKSLEELQVEKALKDYDATIARIADDLYGYVMAQRDEEGVYVYIEVETETDWEEVFRLYVDEEEIQTFGFKNAEDITLIDKMKSAYDNFVVKEYGWITFEEFIMYSERLICDKIEVDWSRYGL